MKYRTTWLENTIEDCATTVTGLLNWNRERFHNELVKWLVYYNEVRQVFVVIIVILVKWHHIKWSHTELASKPVWLIPIDSDFYCLLISSISIVDFFICATIRNFIPTGLCSIELSCLLLVLCGVFFVLKYIFSSLSQVMLIMYLNRL